MEAGKGKRDGTSGFGVRVQRLGLARAGRVQQLVKTDPAVLIPGHVGSGALDDLGSAGQHDAGGPARAGDESGGAGYSAWPSLRPEECQEHGDQEHREDDDHGDCFLLLPVSP